MDIYGYRASYMLLRPHKLIQASFLRVKWAWQRVVRGWDDTVLWSVDAYVAKTMREIIFAFKKELYSVPIKLLPIVEDEPDSWMYDKNTEEAMNKWKEILNEIEEGFEAAQIITNKGADTKEEQDFLVKQFEKGMKLFTEYFFDLWD